MKYTRDVKRLRRDMLIGQVVSALVSFMGLMPICLYINPALVGATDPQGYYHHHNWLIFGVGMLLFGIFSVIISTTWPRRLLWIWKNVRSQPMHLSIRIQEWSDSTDYEALLSANTDPEKTWSVSFYSPSWNVKDLQGTTTSAKVYFDPKSQRPAVIETTQGLLWAMASIDLGNCKI